MARTERIFEQTFEADARRCWTWLVEVGSASAPLRSPRIYSLDEATTVILGRKEDQLSPYNTLRVDVVDPWMSSSHVEIRRTELGWELSDLGSANGTLLWGQRRSTALLSDGDVFETGSTFWLFRSVVAEHPGPRAILGEGDLGTLSPMMHTVHEKVLKVSRSRVPVMFLGATGTGKEVLARALHRYSGRPGRMVAINSASIQNSMVASELFGVVKGAHPMADKDRLGRIRSANQGTILLDEIGDMPLEVQSSMLRVLQENEVSPVGGDNSVPIDVRFISATHQDLSSLVAQRIFRSDLLARLKGCIVDIPTLKERAEDIGLLVGRFLKKLGLEYITFSPTAYRALLVYSWPLNIRELDRALETAAALCEGERIDIEDLPEEIRTYHPPQVRTDRSSEGQREREVMRLLSAHRGNVSAVARSMGYSRMQVHRWLKQLKVDPNEYRGS